MDYHFKITKTEQIVYRKYKGSEEREVVNLFTIEKGKGEGL